MTIGRVDRWEAQVLWKLGEGDCPATAPGVATHFGRRGGWIPERLKC
jgi:hypothetical protein